MWLTGTRRLITLFSNGESRVAIRESETAEVRRAVHELRQALRGYALQGSLPATLMRLATLIDRTSICVSAIEGKASFHLDEATATICFSAEAVRQILDRSLGLSNEVGLSEEAEVARVRQVSVNLFVAHELIHVEQNFPHFATVQRIKAGLPSIGLPMLDVAADTAAAWVSAKIEAGRSGQLDGDSFLRHYVNCLINAYAVGAFVFSVEGRPAKMQRALGLVLSAVLVQAKVDGLLLEDKLYGNWGPGSPLMAFDVAAASSFNAIVLDQIPGLLLARSDEISEALRQAVWSSVGKPPISRTLQLVAQACLEAGAIRVVAAGNETAFSLTRPAALVGGKGAPNG